MNAFDKLEAAAFRIFCRILASDFSSHFKSTATDATLPLFFRKSARTFASYNTISEAYALVLVLNEKFVDDCLDNSLRNVLDTLSVFYDDYSSPFCSNNVALERFKIPPGAIVSETTNWLRHSFKTDKVDAYWKLIMVDDILKEPRHTLLFSFQDDTSFDIAMDDTTCDIGFERDAPLDIIKERRHTLLLDFQRYIVQLNSTIQLRFKGAKGLRRVVPSVHFLLHDQVELEDIFANEYCELGHPSVLYMGLGSRERDMFLRAAFIENDFVIIPFLDHSTSAVRLVVVGYSAKVRHLISFF